MECFTIFKEEGIEYLQKINKLTTEYDELIASAEIEYKGKIYNLSQLTPFSQSEDRKERKEVSELTTKFFIDNEEKFDNIYDQLVKQRHEMAKALGYDSFIDYQYKNLMRVDYNKEDVAKYRDFVREYVTPVYLKLREMQKERTCLDSLKYYDTSFKFKDGNAFPKGSTEEKLEKAKKMYHELSNETAKFIDFMTEKELFDLESKPGKAGGGYCTTLDEYNAPFVFANFNGTTHDVEVLTHELGHAFQSYTSSDGRLEEYIWPTYEACEIHSMSMEFLTWPWMELFFGEDTNKFKFSHLDGAISFIPYGVTVDEFQHWVYENPYASPEERKRKYSEIERKYRPDIDYDDNEFLKKGTYWYRQGHIFSTPFYYIDYTLAQVLAFQFLLKSLDDRQMAFKDYLNICKTGGIKSFFGIIEDGNLKNPMKDGVIEDILPKLLKILEDLKENI